MGQRKNVVDAYKVACPRCGAAVLRSCLKTDPKGPKRENGQPALRAHKERAVAARASRLP